MTTADLIAKAKDDLADHKCYGSWWKTCGICHYIGALDRWLARRPR